MKRFFKSAAFPILLVVILAFVAQRVISPDSGPEPPTYNEFLAKVDQGEIKSVTIKTKDNSLEVTEKPAEGDTGDGEKFETGYPNNTEQSLLNQLDSNNVETTVKGTGGNSLLSMLTYILPFLLFFGFWIFLMNQMQGGGSRVMSFGKSKAKKMAVDAPKISFKDVAGADEAVQELARDQGVPPDPEEVPGARRPDPQGRSALRTSRYRQDPARPGGRR